jgi:hypothetical protein
VRDESGAERILKRCNEKNSGKKGIPEILDLRALNINAFIH